MTPSETSVGTCAYLAVRASALLAHLGATLEPALDRASLELRTLHAVATLVTRVALAREESRDAPLRSDYPVRDDAHFQKHSRITRDQPPEFVSRSVSSDRTIARLPTGMAGKAQNFITANEWNKLDLRSA